MDQPGFPPVTRIERTQRGAATTQDEFDLDTENTEFEPEATEQGILLRELCAPKNIRKRRSGASSPLILHAYTNTHEN